MSTILRHGGGENVRPEYHNFSSQAELLELPFVKRWTDDPRFYRFSVSGEDRPKQPLLMAEYREGREWWVVGYLRPDHGLSLPEWRPVR